MLQSIAPDLWHLQHFFTFLGLRISSRMTVVRLRDNKLWLHSPVPLTPQLRAELESLGQVAYIVAPNKTHHLFVGPYAAAFPDAIMFGAPGLARKRPDLQGLRILSPTGEPEWQDQLDQVFVAGIPALKETAWFHRASRTLILTDLCQWWQGNLSLAISLYSVAAGVRKQLAVPRTIRRVIKDRAAAATSAQKILAWPFERVIVSHNAIVEDGAYQKVKHALSCLDK